MQRKVNKNKKKNIKNNGYLYKWNTVREIHYNN